MVTASCPKCNSSRAQVRTYRGAKVIVCSACGYDEGRILDELPSERGMQKSHNPYRTGGGRRSQT